jgi:DUF1365 family protein
VIRQSCPKCFYGSPFMDMAMTYHFRIIPPAGCVAVAIETRGAKGPKLWRKSMRVRPRPLPPTDPVTAAAPGGTTAGGTAP